MAAGTVVLITGVSKGLGRALVEKYLSRPNHTVIGSLRDSKAPAAHDLENLPAAAGSRLVLVSIEGSSQTDPQQAVAEIAAAGIPHVDLVIANAGLSPPIQPLDVVDARHVADAFEVNALAPLRLYQAVKPLLERSAAPKWVSVSSAAASIGRLEVHQATFVSAYGMSKAAQDWLTVAIHSADKSIVAFAIHPGLVQTEMGNQGAQMQGLEKAPNTVEESIDKTVALIDGATREKTSGRFINVIDGEEIPW
ncbi:Norsolorinic acid ketoreductase nor1 [Colletotrichum spinosum]|uniref:Norsolorinic acid ketoreductase nor1 n=1 Tax=Colletotrichum spinosum TaxID=1347390 RepID=A0A4V6QEG3_9PEZI|nr:Norsolorinic acid ketoreductase nor1 [Colletotrichum spinosum]